MTLIELNSHLFKCADIIHNTVDKMDIKDYILPLVFYRTISNSYQGPYEALLEAYSDRENARRPAPMKPIAS